MHYGFVFATLSAFLMDFTKYIPRVKNVSSLDSLHANSIRGKL